MQVLWTRHARVPCRHSRRLSPPCSNPASHRALSGFHLRPCGNGHRRIPVSWVTMVVHVPRCHQHPWETATLESTWSPHCSRDLVEGTCEARCGTAMLLSCHSVTRLARLVTLMTWTTHRGAHLGPARGPWFLFIPSSLSKHLKTITTL